MVSLSPLKIRDFEPTKKKKSLKSAYRSAFMKRYKKERRASGTGPISKPLRKAIKKSNRRILGIGAVGGAGAGYVAGKRRGKKTKEKEMISRAYKAGRSVGKVFAKSKNRASVFNVGVKRGYRATIPKGPAKKTIFKAPNDKSHVRRHWKKYAVGGVAGGIYLTGVAHGVTGVNFSPDQRKQNKKIIKQINKLNKNQNRNVL